MRKHLNAIIGILILLTLGFIGRVQLNHKITVIEKYDFSKIKHYKVNDIVVSKPVTKRSSGGKGGGHTFVVFDIKISLEDEKDIVFNKLSNDGLLESSLNYLTSKNKKDNYLLLVEYEGGKCLYTKFKNNPSDLKEQFKKDYISSSTLFSICQPFKREHNFLKDIKLKG